MLPSLYTAISGTKAQQNALDATSNNIANAQTVGYKKERASFADLLYTFYVAGGNVSYVGHGTYVTSYQNIMTQGAFETTGRATDLAINGKGFFIVRDPNAYDNPYDTYNDQFRFTRAGEFTIDSEGNLVTPTGQILQGIRRSEDGTFASVTPANLTDVNLKGFEVIPAKETTKGALSFNLNSDTPISTVHTSKINAGFRIRQSNSTFSELTNLTVYDVNGKAYTLSSLLNNSSDANVIFKQREAEIHLALKLKLDASNGTNTGYIPLPVYDGNDRQLFVRFENYDSANRQWDASLYYYDPDTGSYTQIGTTQTGAISFDNAGNLTSGVISFTNIDLDGDGNANETVKIDPAGSYAKVGLSDVMSVLENELISSKWWADIGKDPAGSGNTTRKVIVFDGNGNIVSVKNYNESQEVEAAFEISLNKDLNGDGSNDNLKIDFSQTVLNAQLPKAVSFISKEGFDPKNPNSYGFSTALTVYDSLGNAHHVDFFFIKADKDDNLENGIQNFNFWKWVAFVDGNFDSAVSSGGIQFNESGQIERLYDSNGNLITDENGLPSTSFTMSIPPSMLTNGMPPNLPPNPNYAPSNPITMTLSFAGSTQLAQPSMIYNATQNGYPASQLVEISFEKNGTLIGHYDNGQKIELYKIPLADMTEDSLKRLSDNLWAFAPEVPINNDPYSLIKMDFAMNSGLGEIVGGALEMSNVDLTQEFVDLIVAQRAFQANTKVITTDDEILQTIINLKR